MGKTSASPSFCFLKTMLSLFHHSTEVKTEQKRGGKGGGEFQTKHADFRMWAGKRKRRVWKRREDRQEGMVIWAES